MRCSTCHTNTRRQHDVYSRNVSEAAGIDISDRREEIDQRRRANREGNRSQPGNGRLGDTSRTARTTWPGRWSCPPGDTADIRTRSGLEREVRRSSCLSRSLPAASLRRSHSITSLSSFNVTL